VQEALVPTAGYHVPERLLPEFLVRPFILARFPELAADWRQGRPNWSADVTRDARFDGGPFEGIEAHSVLLAPAMVRGEPVGALFLVWWATGRQFAPAEIRLIEGVASQVGLAMENAELARQTQQKLDETERLLAVSRMLASTPDLETLPRDVGRRIRALEEYDFMEPSARERFQELTDRLRRQTLDRFVDGLSQAIQGTTPEDLQANRDMVRDLNSLLEERLDGREPSQDDVDSFLSRHGGFFPGARTLDDIVEQLTQRMAAMQSLLRSMTPAQRAELQSMMDALLRDDRLRWDLARLASNMDQLMPDGLGEGYDLTGEEGLGLEPALEQIGRLQAMDALEDSLAGVESPGDLADIDRASLSELVGDDAVGDLNALDDLAQRLEAAGYLTRRGERLELTPRGSRRIGQHVLDDLFARLSRDAFGGHRIDRGGRGGEREETAKPYEFGDPFHLDIRGTIENAVRRPENAPAVRGTAGVSLAADDFQVFRTEQLTRTSTVLLVDMSRSMLLRGCFVAAKKVAVALDTLIRTQYPHDDLAVIGFAYYARELRPEALAELTWHGYEYGTNLQHGLMLARRFLARHHGGARQIVVITDGEPTAHFENGQFFACAKAGAAERTGIRRSARARRSALRIDRSRLVNHPRLPVDASARQIDHARRLVFQRIENIPRRRNRVHHQGSRCHRAPDIVKRPIPVSGGYAIPSG
jgi:uncharacterized protein with von Willebrand factor type A (vWA) domain